MKPGRALLFLVLLLPLACGRMGDPFPPGSGLIAPPGSVVVMGRGDKVVLGWAPPSRSFGGGPGEIEGYIVERQSWEPGVDPCRECPAEYEVVARIDSEKRKIDGGAPTGYRDDTVSAGYIYRYRVTAIASTGRLGTPSPPVEVTFEPLEAPEITVTPIEEGVLISYKGPASPLGSSAEGLNVFDGRGKLLARMSPSDDEGKIIGLTNGEEVSLDMRWSVVTTLGARLESPPVRVKVTPADTQPPEPPGDLAAFPEGGAVRLMWVPPTGEQYEEVIITRAVKGNEPLVIARVSGNSASYLDKAVTPGVTYIYGCKGIDRAGNESGLSPKAKITLAR